MKRISALIIAMAAMTMLGCPKKPEPVTEPAAPDSTSSSVSANAEDSAAIRAKLEAERLENERLEAQRKKLEEMMNRLMAEEVYFEYDQAVLTEKARELLSEAGDILAKEPRLVVQVEGHTDERGTEAYNLSLGGKRAQTVRQYLLDYGVDPARITTVSYGEEKPKVEGNDESAYAQNRRAAFRVQVR